jgi:hypothetical protein
MPIFKKDDWWYARIDRYGKRWTPSIMGTENRRWKTKKEAKLGERELRQLVELLKNNQKKTTLETVCAAYLEDAEVSYAGHDTFSGKERR